MRKIFCYLLISLYLNEAFCKTGVDVSQLFSVQSFTCLKNQGVEFAIARGYLSSGRIDQNTIQSLTNIKAAGISAGTYMFPCRGKDPVTQVNELIENIPSNLYDRIWIDVQSNPSQGCSWAQHDAESNCQFLIDTINQIKLNQKPVGIYASNHMWTQILGSSNACMSASVGLPLWYAHYDHKPDFSDFVAFAGWKTPNIKQYQGTTSECGASIDKNWMP